MTDMKKTIDDLELLNRLCHGTVLDDALALLKEQQQQIWELQDQVEYLTDKQKEQEHKDRMFHALEDDWKRLKELLKEQENEKKRNPVIVCPHCGKRVK